MRVRTMATAALAAATLTIGGSAAAYASTPAPPPDGKATVKVFTCKDGKIKVEEARLADGEPGVVFRLPDGEGVAAGSDGPRLHVTEAAPAGEPSFSVAPSSGAVAALPAPEGLAGVMITRVDAGHAVPFVEPKEGDDCSALFEAVPAAPAQPVK